ncbi:hypothetical protein SI859A1_02024 [Aurantimonas manganoxydans SI85-9A1]|uniref:Uncharacterized protein n=1 Tax=Aurantimonas manganoxydans (strain ATCC BAA-1229 / DSM 21871 / SI85-9A1) TaxID=287752 RepID=Q1YN20_AURMS|nr:hypothetical protein SI859A1_02024 [Aurantimonas manganoxydans SI85-9A1]
MAYFHSAAKAGPARRVSAVVAARVLATRLRRRVFIGLVIQRSPFLGSTTGGQQTIAFEISRKSVAREKSADGARSAMEFRIIAGEISRSRIFRLLSTGFDCTNRREAPGSCLKGAQACTSTTVSQRSHPLDRRRSASEYYRAVSSERSPECVRAGSRIHFWRDGKRTVRLIAEHAQCVVI